MTGNGLLATLLTNEEVGNNFRALISNLRSHGILFYRDSAAKAEATRQRATPLAEAGDINSGGIIIAHLEGRSSSALLQSLASPKAGVCSELHFLPAMTPFFTVNLLRVLFVTFALPSARSLSGET